MQNYIHPFNIGDKVKVHTGNAVRVVSLSDFVVLGEI